MEIIFEFGEKIHVQKDVHQIMTLHEHIRIIHLEIICNMAVILH
jgi:hypothetical protein